MFPHSYKECFVLLPNRCGISQFTPLRGPAFSLALIPFSNRCGTPQSTLLRCPVSLLAYHLVSTPLRGSASSLAHCLVSGSDTIYNSQSPLLADIVFFGLSLKVFKTSLLGRGFHTLIKNALFSSPTDVKSQLSNYKTKGVKKSSKFVMNIAWAQNSFAYEQD